MGWLVNSALAERVPGFSALPIDRRARVVALAVLQLALNRAPLAASRVLARSPGALTRLLRRWTMPVRIARPMPAELDRVAAAEELEARALSLDVTPASSPEACLIVPTYGALEWLRLCLLAVRAHTPPAAYQLVVVDDGSPHPDAVERIVRQHAHAELVRLEQNLGFAAAVNRGASRARAPVLVILNDDAVVTPGWLEGLLGVLATAPDVALVGPVGNDTGDQATLEARYSSLDELVAFAGERSGDPRTVEKLSLFCAAVRRSVFEELGGLCEGYGRGLFEDDDLCMALKARGYDTRLVPRVFVHHAAGASFRRLPPFEYFARFEVNRDRFERRWGVRWRATGLR